MKNLRCQNQNGLADARWLFLLILILLIAGCTDQKQTSSPVSFSGQTMGTLYTVKLVEPDAVSDERLNELQNGVEEILVKINQQMSAYDSLSEISTFNRSIDTGWFEVSAAFAAVVDSSLEICRQSNGALDITVAPLVNLWGFGPEHVPQVIPSPAQLDSALKEIGYDKLEVRLAPPAIKKLNRNISCDLAAVAKGYAVDRIASYLSDEGVVNHLVEVGGEIKATGKNADGSDWRVGIKTPDTTTAIQQAVILHNQAMATSGSYLNYFEKDGKRYSHLIDPRTGSPIQHHLVSVSIVHESCLLADAMATAISVAGPDQGYQLALDMNLAVFLIVRKDDHFTELMTPGFEKLMTTTM